MRPALITKLPRLLVVVAVIAGTVAFAAADSSIAATIASGVGRMSLLPVLAGLGLSIAAVINRGLLAWTAHRAVGLAVEPVAMTGTATVGFAANKILRSGGASGLTVFVRHGNRMGLAAGRVACAYALASVASFAALGILMSSTVGVLALTGRLAGWWLAASVGFAVYSLLLALLVIAIVTSRALTRKLFGAAWRLKGRLTRSGSIDTTQSAYRSADDLHDSINTARRHPRAMRNMLGYAVLSKVLGAMALFVAAAATGVHVTLITAMILYATALATSLISVVPGGVGPVEASTAAMLMSLGATLPAAALTVALFRIFDMWLPVAAGAYLGRHDLRRAETPEPDEPVRSPVPPRAQLVAIG